MKDELDFVAKINDGEKINSIDNQKKMRREKNSSTNNVYETK